MTQQHEQTEKAVREAILKLLISDMPLDYSRDIDLDHLLNPPQQKVTSIPSAHVMASLLVFSALKGNTDAQRWVVSVIDRHFALPF